LCIKVIRSSSRSQKHKSRSVHPVRALTFKCVDLQTLFSIHWYISECLLQGLVLFHELRSKLHFFQKWSLPFRYQIILHDDRGTKVCASCRRLVCSSTAIRNRTVECDALLACYIGNPVNLPATVIQPICVVVRGWE